MHLHYSLHGLIILLTGMLGGIAFSSAIKSDNGREVAWRVVHSGGSMAGVALIAIGIVVTQFNLGGLLDQLIYYSFVGGTYLLVIGMIIAAVTGRRGLGRNEARRTKWGMTVYVMYGLGSILSLAALVILIIACAYILLR